MIVLVHWVIMLVRHPADRELGAPASASATSQVRPVPRLRLRPSRHARAVSGMRYNSGTVRRFGRIMFNSLTVLSLLLCTTLTLVALAALVASYRGPWACLIAGCAKQRPGFAIVNHLPGRNPLHNSSLFG